jgi:hypothetical protein
MTLPRHHAIETHCTHCGDRIDISQWYPIETVVDGGDVRLHRFCTRDCRNDWTENS